MANINFKKIFFYVLTIQTIVISTTIYRYNLPLFPNEVTVNLTGLNTLRNNLKMLSSDDVSKEIVVEKGQINLTEEMVLSVSKEIEKTIKTEKKKIAFNKPIRIEIQRSVTTSEITKPFAKIVSEINNKELVSLSGFKKQKIKIEKIKVTDDIIKEENIQITNSGIQKETTNIAEKDIEEIAPEEEMVVYEYSKENDDVANLVNEKTIPKAFDQKLSPTVLKAISRETDKKIISKNENKVADKREFVTTEVVEKNDLTIFDYTKTEAVTPKTISKFVENRVETSLIVNMANNQETEYRIVNLADENEESIGQTGVESIIKNEGDIFAVQLLINDYPVITTELLKGNNEFTLPRKDFFNEESFDGNKGMILAEASGELDLLTTGSVEEKSLLDENYKKITNSKQARYVLLKNIEPGLHWLRSGEYKRWVNVRPGEINLVKLEISEASKRLDLYKKELMGSESSLNIQGSITSLNSKRELNKIALNKFQGKIISDKTQKPVFKINGMNRKLLMNVSSESKINVPSENVVSYIMNQTGLNTIENSCLVFAEIKDELIGSKVNGKLSVGNMFVDMKYIQKTGEISSEPTEATAWILIYGEGEGQIFLSNEYSSGDIEQRNIPCIEDTVILDYL